MLYILTDSRGVWDRYFDPSARKQMICYISAAFGNFCKLYLYARAYV